MIWSYLEVFTKIRQNQKLYADDSIDKLNRSVTVILLIIAAIFIGSKNFGTPIACLKNSNDFAAITIEYINAVCWVKKTIIVDEFFQNSKRNEMMQLERTNTYPWLMLVCVALAFLFYVPYVVWKYLIKKNTYNNVPIDISKIVCSLRNCSLEKTDDFANKITNIGGYLDRCFSLNNFNDSYLDEREDFSKYFDNNQFKNQEPKTYQDRIYKRQLKIVYIPLAIKYLFIKTLYLIISILIFLIIDGLLGFRESFYYYGINMIFRFNSNNSAANENITNKYFPHHVICEIGYLGDVKDPQFYRFQCSLPANFFNEIIFLILWFWFLIIVIANFYSLFNWIFIFLFRKTIITNMLIWPFKYSYRIDGYIDSFVNNYLTSEGILVLMLIKSNTQDWHCRSLVRVLWKFWASRFVSEQEILTPRVSEQKSPKSAGSTVKMSNRRDLNYEPLRMMEISTPIRSSNPSHKIVIEKSEKCECKNNFKINEDMV